MKTSNLKEPLPLFEFRAGDPYSIRDNVVRVGTWFVEPEHTQDWVIAFLACPSCGNVSTLSCREFQITKQGVVDFPWSCKSMRADKSFCMFKSQISLKDWPGRETEKLFAICFEQYRPNGGWRAVIDYTHAINEQRARFVFQSTVRDPKTVRRVVIGRAIGFFVDDNQGMELSV